MQSPERLLSRVGVAAFTLFGLVCLLAAPAAAWPAFADAAPAVPRRLAVHAGGSYKVHVGSFGQQWAPYGAAAFAVDLPTYLRNVLFRLDLDAGIMRSLPQAELPAAYHRAYIGEAAASLSYDFYLPRNEVTLRPRLGLSSTMVQFSRWSPTRKFQPFGSSENEFGLLVGVEPLWKMERLSISFPVQFNYTFSGPHRFMTFSTTLFLGGIF